MLKEKLKKIFFDHPTALQTAKIVLSHKIVANNPLYKNFVMKKARRYAKECKEYEQVISIETTLSCNARCVFCAHHNRVMTGTMTMELFEKIIDDCHARGIKLINFGVYGELLTDKFLFERINYLRERDMTYSFFSNASLLTPETTDKLLAMGGLASVNFSINGFSNEVYEKTMINLKRDITYKNALYFLEQKEKLGLNNLSVHISAVRTKLNKKDFKDFFKFWKKQKGVSMVWSLELMDRMGSDYDGQLGKLGPMDNAHNWLSPCKLLWGPLSVYFDGRVSPCCKDDDKRELIIGDLNKQSLIEILNGEPLKKLRELHLSDKRDSHPICGKCYLNSVWLS
jgi:MoaA/NifB/PqqE/SkfB family radical SAM enzyme